jgi:hypothetical protein
MTYAVINKFNARHEMTVNRTFFETENDAVAHARKLLGQSKSNGRVEPTLLIVKIVATVELMPPPVQLLVNPTIDMLNTPLSPARNRDGDLDD